MPRAVSALLCALLLGPALCQAPLEAAPPPVVPAEHDAASADIQCGRLIDGLASRPRTRVTLRVREGRVQGITRGFRHDPASRLVDLRGYTCLPGLIDMHTHMTDRPEDLADLKVYFHRTRAETLEVSRANAAATLDAGFTTARNVGAYLAWADRDLRDAINRGDFPGPRLQISGPYLSIPGGGGDLLVPGVSEADTPAEVRAGVARGPEQFTARAARQIAGGADLLKVIASGAVLAYGGVPGAPEMNPAELSAVVKEAHAAGLRVAAHAHGAQSIKDALRAGVDTIEHASMIDDEGIALARERGAALAMDIYNGDYIDSEGRRQGWPAEFLRKNIETTEVQRQGFTRALHAGVPIVFASDAGVFPHGQNARQFAIMVARGMTPMQAIQSATSVAAERMGWQAYVGALVAGRYADLIAVKDDPLQNIRSLESVSYVIKGGHVERSPSPATP